MGFTETLLETLFLSGMTAVLMTVVLHVQELFMFLEDGDAAPRGGATADKLAVELTAGGLTPEHTRLVSCLLLGVECLNACLCVCVCVCVCVWCGVVWCVCVCV